MRKEGRKKEKKKEKRNERKEEREMGLFSRACVCNNNKVISACEKKIIRNTIRRSHRMCSDMESFVYLFLLFSHPSPETQGKSTSSNGMLFYF